MKKSEHIHQLFYLQYGNGEEGRLDLQILFYFFKKKQVALYIYEKI
jgi:hypothetical protein